MQTDEHTITARARTGVSDTQAWPVGATAVHEREQTLIAADGYALGATVFEPDSRAASRGVIVMLGAVAVPQTYYHKLARYLAGAGYQVLTCDYRGVGRSRPKSLRGMAASLTDWARLDARAVLAHAGELAGGKPISAIGHSFGGQLIGVIDDMRMLSCAVLVAAQLPHVSMYPAPTRVRYAITFHAIMPLIATVCGYLPGSLGLGTDLPKQATLEWARWLTSPGYLRDHVSGSGARFAAFDRPVLHLSFSDDELAPAASVTAMIDALSAAKLEERRITPAQLGVPAIGHHGFFRPKFEATLWSEARAFIDRATNAH